jgi:hypothetical protein
MGSARPRFIRALLAQVRTMIGAIAPDAAKVAEFETVIRDVFPQ